MIAYAAEAAHIVAANNLVTKIQNIILTPLVSLMVSLALLLFMWGAFEFVRNADNESGRKTGKMHMLYGIIGMLVMLSALAILKIAAATFGVTVPE